jgi:hypothetical protein
VGPERLECVSAAWKRVASSWGSRRCSALQLENSGADRAGRASTLSKDADRHRGFSSTLRREARAAVESLSRAETADAHAGGEIPEPGPRDLLLRAPGPTGVSVVPRPDTGSSAGQAGVAPPLPGFDLTSQRRGRNEPGFGKPRQIRVFPQDGHLRVGPPFAARRTRRQGKALEKCSLNLPKPPEPRRRDEREGAALLLFFHRSRAGSRPNCSVAWSSDRSPNAERSVPDVNIQTAISDPEPETL